MFRCYQIKKILAGSFSISSLLLVGFGPCYATEAMSASRDLRTDHLYHHVQRLNETPAGRTQPITVILETDNLNQPLHQLIKVHDGVVRYSQGRRHELVLPAARMMALLEKIPTSAFVRLPYPMEAVAVTSQGISITGAGDGHVLGNYGEGVKVGVIDMGFTSYTNAQASGDLPVNLSIVDYTGEGTGGTNHGTQVAEIIHDMAPDAELYLAKVSTSLQLQQAVNDMIAAGVKIINHSVAWFGAAFYDGTGVLCDITDQVQSSGVLWVNAAGNSRTKHYLGVFTDLDGDLSHEFASGQNYNTINLAAGGSATLILSWDAYPVTNIDYNLYLYNGNPDSGGVLVTESTDRQSGNASSYPYEVINFTASVAGTYYIVVTKSRSSTTNIPLTLFSIGPDLVTRTLASSLSQPADCASALSVGATNLIDGAESFSSEGPTTDGREKPEISATNRVQTSLSSVFAGTSAAAPHAAGMAAMLLAENPAASVSGLRYSLVLNAFDVHSIGYDFRTGYGRISLDADGDLLNHDEDNCPLVANSDQIDTDNNGIGDVCEPPRISGVWSTSVEPGSYVFVFGSYFDQMSTQVNINGIQVPLVQVVSQDMLVFILPAGNVLGPIQVTTSHGSAIAPSDFGSTPISIGISGIWPGSVVAGEYMSVFIFGSGFVPDQTNVFINDVEQHMVAVASPEMLIVRILATPELTGHVTVATPEGSAVSDSMFVVIP